MASNLRKIHGLNKPKGNPPKERTESPQTSSEQKITQTPILPPKTSQAKPNASGDDIAPEFRERYPGVVGVQKVVAACGHTTNFPLFPDPQDRFRARRLEKFTDRDCADCRAAKHQATTRAEQQAKQERLAREGSDCGKGKRPYTPRWKRNATVALARLPHNSTFQDLRYDAGRVMWTGKLLIPGLEHPKEFNAEASAVFRLLEELDRLYREWLNSPAPTKEKTS